VIQAVATPCHDYERCWRPLPVPDDFPFVSPVAAALWLGLLVVCVVLLAHRLGRD
jgi:hypothetical protein